MTFCNYFDLEQIICIFVGWWCFIVFNMFSRFLIMRMISLCRLWSFVFKCLCYFLYTSLLLGCEDTIAAVLDIGPHSHWWLWVSIKGWFIINAWWCKVVLFLVYWHLDGSYIFCFLVHFSWNNWPLYQYWPLP